MYILKTVKISILIMLLITSAPNLNSWISQGCYEETTTAGNAGNPGKFFDKSDADRLMGEPTYLADSSLTREAGVSSYRCSYKAYAADKRTGKTGAVYFLMEQYLTTALAEKKYAVIREANTRQGIEELTNLGDEAFRRRNFNLIMVRKGRNVFTIKMNREAQAVTLKELTQTAEKIVEAIR